MSSVLRPQYGNFKRKSEEEPSIHKDEEIVPYTPLFPSVGLEGSLPVPQNQEDFLPYKEIIIEEKKKTEKPVEMIKEEIIVPTFSQTREIPLVAKNISEEEKISEALEKILERKIEKAISGAEAELDTLKTEHVGGEIKVTTRQPVLQVSQSNVVEIVHENVPVSNQAPATTAPLATESIPVLVPSEPVVVESIPVITIKQNPTLPQNEIATPVPVQSSQVALPPDTTAVTV